MLEMSQSCLLSRTVGWWLCGALVNKTSHFDWWEPKICFTASQMETIHSAVCCVVFSHSKGRKTAYFLVKGNEKRLFIYMHKHTQTKAHTVMVWGGKKNTKRFSPNFCRFPLSWTESLLFFNSFIHFSLDYLAHVYISLSLWLSYSAHWCCLFTPCLSE